MLELLKSLEWSSYRLGPDHRMAPACPSCKGLDPDDAYGFLPEYHGHRDDCELDKVLMGKMMVF